MTMTPDTTNPQKLFHGVVAPRQVTFNLYVNPSANVADGAGVFALPSDLVSYVSGIVGQNQGLQGLYNQRWETILDAYFQSPADEALSVVQGQIALFEMTMPASVRGELPRPPLCGNRVGAPRELHWHRQPDPLRHFL